MNVGLALLARTLLAAIFLISGVRKVLGFGAVAAMMADKGFPIAPAFLVATIALEIIGGVMLIANWHARYAAWALAAFTLAAGSIFHGFWHAAPAAFLNEFNHFLKNVAIVGGLLLVAAQPPPRE
jgi:putative oxidoreductase